MSTTLDSSGMQERLFYPSQETYQALFKYKAFLTNEKGKQSLLCYLVVKLGFLRNQTPALLMEKCIWWNVKVCFILLKEKRWKDKGSLSMGGCVESEEF